MTTATMSKQEVREAYIASVQDKIVFLLNGWARVPSSDEKHCPYIVTIVDGKATDCGCDGCYRNGAKVLGYCRHREAVDTYLARQAEVQQVVDEPAHVDHLATYSILDVADTIRVDFNRVRCGGCGCTCGEGKGDRCHVGFCFWNSWWTEAQRNAA